MTADQGQHFKEPSRKRDFLSRLLLVLGLFLLAAALAIGGYVAWQYINAQNRYREVAALSGLELDFGEVVSRDLVLESLYFNWDELRAMNPDVVGWIIVPGTYINYPIVQGPNNEYYLYHLFDASSSGTGAIFADYQGSRSLDAPNNIIYGHNMLDSSMFSDLNMYTRQDYFDDHMVVYLGTPARNYALQAFAVTRQDQSAPLRTFSFADEQAYRDYIDTTFANPLAAVPDFATAKQDITSLYSLVTCNSSNDAQRVVVSCIPMRSVEQ